MAGSRPAEQRSRPSGLFHASTATKKHPGSKLQCNICMSRITSQTNTCTPSRHCMLTRGIAASVSRNAVFNTLELLENVLLQLPHKDIISARVVNKHWNALITTSPRIRRKLFLLAEPETSTWTFDSKNVLIMEGKDSQNKKQPGTDWTIPAKLNDLLFTRQPASLRSSMQKRMKTCEPISLHARPNLGKRHSIYHQMLVSQPPSKEVQFEFYFDRSRRAGRRPSRYYGEARMVVKVANSAGVTFGDLIREFHAAVERDAAELPSTGYLIKVAASTLWMAGVVFATDEETATVKKAAN